MAQINEPKVDAALRDQARRAVWIGLLTGGSVLFSLALACAMPFAALVSLAALNMSRRDAIVLTATVWLANQAVGFGTLHYPHTWSTYGWGLAIGVAALLALPAASVAGARLARGGIAALAAAFVAAFVTYEVVLFIVSFVLPGGSAAFSWPVIGWILETNLFALIGLLALDRAAVTIGLIKRSNRAVAAAAA
jgi:hypothetical protein